MAPTIEEQQSMEFSRRMRNLQKDIVIEILSWVPADTLLRWRWVCKYWFHLIKNPNFIQKHLHHSTTTQCSHDLSILISTPIFNGSDYLDLQCYLNYTTCSFSNSTLIISHPFKSPYHLDLNTSLNWFLFDNPELITSVNGLLFRYKYNEKRFCIWNPCTKEYIVLPDPPFIKFDRYHERLVRQYGFGYDHTINDYKVVVRNEYIDNCLPSEVQVYTLGTSSWRKIRPVPIKELQTQRDRGVYMNGALHWLDSLGEKIISFDIGKEKFKQVLIKQPKCSHGILQRHTMRLQAFEGSLCCLVKLTNIDNPAIGMCCLEMWTMSDYDVNTREYSWTTLFSTLVPSDSFDLYYDSLKPLKLTRKGKILMLKDLKYLVLCDPKTKRIKTLNTICEKNYHVEEVYVESLVSLNSGNNYAAIEEQKEKKINEDEIEIDKNKYYVVL